VVKKIFVGCVCVAMLLSGGATAEIQRGYYDDPGIYPNRDYVSNNHWEHIDPFNGSAQHQYVDLHIPGNGKFDLKVIRTYSSAMLDAAGEHYTQISPGWDLHFGRVVTSGSVCQNANAGTSNENPVWIGPDGARQTWYYPPGSQPWEISVLTSPQGWRLICTTGTNGYLTVFSPDGVQYEMRRYVFGWGEFNGAYIWQTTKITDRNGNYATITYPDAVAPEVGTVQTNDGRVLTFSYANVGNQLGLKRLFKIQANSGQSVSYDYSWIDYLLPGLSSVTRSDGTKWQYGYVSPSFTTPGHHKMAYYITPWGGRVDYSYTYVDFDGTGVQGARLYAAVTGKTSSDGGIWTYAYSPSKSLGTYDVTTESSPAGTTVYRHFGYQTVANGEIWRIGLLASKSISGVQDESYIWDKRLMSNEAMSRAVTYMNKYDTTSNTPVLVSKTINRGASHVTNYSNFDAYGNPRLVTERGPNGGARDTVISYYINTDLWIVKQPQNETYSGSSITRDFDAKGNLSSISRDGVITRFGYDTQGNVSSVTMPRGLVTTYSNYKRGIPQSESQPEGVSISRIVSDAGNVTSETNGEGKTKTFSYDLMNRVTGIDFPIGSSVGISYTATSKTATRGGLIESTLYDGFGRPVSVTLGGVKRTYTYDTLGRKIFESNPGATIGTNYQYDILSRVTRVTNADSTFQTRNYGAGTVKVTDERSKVTTYAYRAYGDPDKQFLMSITAPDTAANITLTRNSKDLVASIKQGALTRIYGYNSNYYLTSVTNPETGKTTYGRDAAGNMTSRTVGTSGTSTYTYDGQNRLTAVTYPGTTPSVTQIYSKTHKLKSVVSSAASRSYLYDANDNLTSESVVVDSITLTTGYGYNTLDQLASVTYPYSARQVTFSPDVLGRPTAISGYITAVAYWPSGQVKQIDYANGTTSTYGQNSRLWPSSFATRLGSTLYNNGAYTYDGAGNLTAISDSADTNYSRTLGYDAINRLTTANGPWGTGTIVYNGVGNLVSQVFGSNNLYYTYDTQNRLSSVSGSRVGSYTYDAYGDIATGTGNAYVYDGVPNLKCVNCSTANEVAHTYDGLNQRVSVTKGGVKTYEVYGSHGNLLAEYTPSKANKLVEYIYLGGKRVAQRESSQ
jgi:YD repeat-containing protein